MSVRVRQEIANSLLTQKELAKALGIHRVHLSRVVNGHSRALPTRLRLARFFKVSYDYLWEDGK